MAEISLTNTLATPTTATLTSGMSASEAKQILSGLGINVNDVLSANNIQQTINSPAPAPDDLLGIRRSLYSDLGVDSAQQDYQAKLAQALGASTQLGNDLTALGGRAVSMSKVVGTQGQLERVRSGSIKALQDAANLSLSNYQAKKGEADTQFSIRESEVRDKKTLMAQYPGAGIKFTDSFEGSMNKVEKYAQKQKKEAYKDELRKMAMSMGIKTKGSTKELEKRISKVNKNAAAQAKKESDLKLQALELDIANTKSIIANRGSGSNDPLADLKRRSMELDIAKAEKDLNSPDMNPLQEEQLREAKMNNDYMESQLNTTNNKTWYNPFSWF